MVRNYFKIALRSIKRHKGYSFLNISGLAIGLACCILILLYVLDEMSFDRSHKLGDRIFRVAAVQTKNGESTPSALTSAPLASSLKQDIPEIKEAACFNHTAAGPIRYGGKFFDPDIFGFLV